MINRRTFLKNSLSAAALTALPTVSYADDLEEGLRSEGMPDAKATSMIMIWLAGGVAQSDTWDAKRYTPFEAGMTSNQVVGTCPVIDTNLDDVRFGAGLERMASVMDRGTIVRTVAGPGEGSPNHLSWHRNGLCGYYEAQAFTPPNMGSVVARTLGPKEPGVPAYINVGRDFSSGGQDVLTDFDEVHGAGFLGMDYSPFVITDPSKGTSFLQPRGDTTIPHLQRRLDYLNSVSGGSGDKQATNIRAYLKSLQDAMNLMDSPVRDAFNFMKDESPESLAAYNSNHEFGFSCLFARRLIEIGSRYVMVEFPYRDVFPPDIKSNLFDTHNNAATTLARGKTYLDGPIAQLITDLDDRGLLETTIVVVASEFGRTVIDGSTAPTMTEYGPLAHFHNSSMLCFGGGFKRGHVHGTTADEHPMVPLEDSAVTMKDMHATIYQLLGIAPDVYYVHEKRPIYITDGGKPIESLIA